MTTLPVSRGRAEDPAATGSAGDERCTYAGLSRDALAVAASMPPGTGHVVVLAEDRYWFTVALLGAWQASAQVVLPASRTEEALRALRERWPDIVVLHDGGWTEVPPLQERAGPGTDATGGVLAPLPQSREIATLFTSGTTASSTLWPKTARQLVGEAHLWADLLALSPSDHVLSTVLPHHIYGLLFGTLLPLSAGASFTRRSVLLPQEVSAAARAAAATVLVSTPAHLRSLVTLPAGSLGRVRVVLSSGAPLPRETGRAICERFGAEVIEILGSTETGGIARRRGDMDEPWSPLPGVDIDVDVDDRLVVRSPFVPDPQAGHVTADRVELVSEGRFVHRGRVDAVVKIAGRRLDCTELEARALALPGVTDAAVLAIAVDGLRGMEVWLGVVAPTWTARGIRRALSAHFEAPLMPRTIRVLKTLPRGEGGKLRRDDLRVALASPEEGDVAPRPAFEVVRRDAARDTAKGEVHATWVRVAPDAPHFEGHFPGDEVLPAVAQLAGLVLPETRRAWPDLGAVSGAPRLKWSSLVRPGAELTLELTRKAGATRVGYVLSGAGEICASGVLAFSPSAAP